MLAVKGRYNGSTVILDSIPPIKECEVIVKVSSDFLLQLLSVTQRIFTI